jgi:Ca2+-binding EF-hand superfamily protein
MRFWIAVPAAMAMLSFAPMLWAGDEKPAAEGGGDGAALFGRLDADKDGQVTASEAGQEHRRLFDRLMRNADKDANGQLNQEEFVAGLKDKGPGRERGDRPDGPSDAGRRGAGRFGQMADRLREFDKNADGKIELDEVPEERQEMFEMVLDRFDKNDDDAMDLAEIGAAVKEFSDAGARLVGRGGDRPDGPPGSPPGPPPVIVALDIDADGTLSTEEIEGATAALKKLDKDSDGKLSREELLPPRGRDGGPERQFDPEQFARRLLNGDKNGDGKLQQDELPEGMQRRFDRMDANSDGAVDSDELKAAIERFQQRARPGDGAATESSDNAIAKAKKKAERMAKNKGAKKKPKPTST